MKYSRQQTRNYSVYGAIVLLDVCVVAMLFMVVSVQSRPVVATLANEIYIPKPAAIAPRAAKQGVPDRVIVPSVSLDMKVKTGSYTPNDDTWTIGDDTAFFADRTVPTNSSNGATLIYGHGTQTVFGSLPSIAEGAIATVYTENGLIFTYKFQSSRQVTPDDTSMLVSSGPPTLVLQTCSGAFDAYRTLVEFRLTGVTEV